MKTCTLFLVSFFLFLFPSLPSFLPSFNTESHYAALHSLYRPGWPQTHRELPASAYRFLKACTWPLSLFGSVPCSPGWPGAHCAAKDDLEPLVLLSSLSTMLRKINQSQSDKYWPRIDCVTFPGQMWTSICSFQELMTDQRNGSTQVWLRIRELPRVSYGSLTGVPYGNMATQRQQHLSKAHSRVDNDS